MLKLKWPAASRDQGNGHERQVCSAVVGSTAAVSKGGVFPGKRTKSALWWAEKSAAGATPAEFGRIGRNGRNFAGLLPSRVSFSDIVPLGEKSSVWYQYFAVLGVVCPVPAHRKARRTCVRCVRRVRRRRKSRRRRWFSCPSNSTAASPRSSACPNTPASPRDVGSQTARLVRRDDPAIEGDFRLSLPPLNKNNFRPFPLREIQLDAGLHQVRTAGDARGAGAILERQSVLCLGGKPLELERMAWLVVVSAKCEQGAATGFRVEVFDAVPSDAIGPIRDVVQVSAPDERSELLLIEGELPLGGLVLVRASICWYRS